MVSGFTDKQTAHCSASAIVSSPSSGNSWFSLPVLPANKSSVSSEDVIRRRCQRGKMNPTITNAENMNHAIFQRCARVFRFRRWSSRDCAMRKRDGSVRQERGRRAKGKGTEDSRPSVDVVGGVSVGSEEEEELGWSSPVGSKCGMSTS